MIRAMPTLVQTTKSENSHHGCICLSSHKSAQRGDEELGEFFTKIRLSKIMLDKYQLLEIYSSNITRVNPAYTVRTAVGDVELLFFSCTMPVTNNREMTEQMLSSANVRQAPVAILHHSHSGNDLALETH